MELVAAGTRLFHEACASCHGQPGEGVVNLGTPLVASAFIYMRSDEELCQFIRTGRAANAPDHQRGIAMPSSGGRLDLTDMDLLAIIYCLRME